MERAVARSTNPSDRLKRAMTALGTAERCALCGTEPLWRGRPLPLEVDHIDGNWRDNRIENLRLLCPNCHSATDTYRGRDKGPPYMSRCRPQYTRELLTRSRTACSDIDEVIAFVGTRPYSSSAATCSDGSTHFGIDVSHFRVASGPIP